MSSPYSGSTRIITAAERQMEDEHEEYATHFDFFIARVLGELYCQRGREVGFHPLALCGEPDMERKDVRYEAACNAIEWLHKFGYIDGTLIDEGEGQFLITPTGMAVLNRPVPGSPGENLGDAAAKIIKSGASEVGKSSVRSFTSEIFGAALRGFLG